MFRKAFELFATPVVVEFRSDKNPFDTRTARERGNPRANQKGSKRGVSAGRKAMKQRGRH